MPKLNALLAHSIYKDFPMGQLKSKEFYNLSRIFLIPLFLMDQLVLFNLVIYFSLNKQIMLITVHSFMKIA